MTHCYTFSRHTRTQVANPTQPATAEYRAYGFHHQPSKTGSRLIALLLPLLLAIPMVTQGQTDTYIPHGATCSDPIVISENPAPANTFDASYPICYSTSGCCQIIFTSDELSACGITSGSTISSLAFQLIEPIRNGNPTVTIWVSETSNSTITSWLPRPATPSSSRTLTCSSAGWVEFEITDYTYTGQNLLISISTTRTTNCNDLWGTYPTATQKAWYNYSNSAFTGEALTTSNKERPRIRLTTTPPPPPSPSWPICFNFDDDWTGTIVNQPYPNTSVYTGLPTGWNSIYSGNATSNSAVIFNSASWYNSNSLLLQASNGNYWGINYGSCTYVILPQIPGLGEDDTMFFKAITNAYTNDNISFSVGYITDVADASTFHEIGTPTVANYYGASESDMSHTLILPDVSGAYIAFKYCVNNSSGNGYAIALDDICFNHSCEPPICYFDEHTIECTEGGSCTGQTVHLDLDNDGSVTYSSSNTSVASVDDPSTGAITLNGSGTALITASVTGSSKYCDTRASYRIIVHCGDTPGTITYHTEANCTGTASLHDWSETATSTAITYITPSCTPATPSPCRFVEWNTAANGSGTTYMPGQYIDLSCGDMELYAIYKYTKDTLPGPQNPCEAMVFCTSSEENNGVVLEAVTNSPAPTGMCSYFHDASWWYIEVAESGNLEITISGTRTGGGDLDVDFGCWGPFDNFTCAASALSNASTADFYFDTRTGAGPWQPERHGTNLSDPEYHAGAILNALWQNNPNSASNNGDGNVCMLGELANPSGNLVDFGGSIAGTEYLQIPNAEAGKVYMIVVANYSNDPGYINFQQTNFGVPGAAVLDCNNVSDCIVNAITIDTSSCNPSTNTYSVSGEIYLTSSQPIPNDGILTIEDPVTGSLQVFYAPFTSPISYTISGLLADGADHNLVAVFTSNDINCTKNQDYTAPDACLTCSAEFSTTPSCNNIDNGTATITVTSGTAPYQYSSDGGTTWTSPATDATSHTFENLPAGGTYTLQVRDNAGCISEETVTVPASDLSATSLVVTPTSSAICSDGNVILHTGTTTPTGGTPSYTYTWRAEGGVVTPRPTTSEVACARGVASSGSSEITFWLIVTDANGCKDSTSTVVSVYPVPFVDAEAENACLGQPVTLLLTEVSGGTTPYVDTIWYIGSTQTHHVDHISITPTEADVYYYSVQVRDSRNCRFTRNIEVEVYDIPSVGAVTYNQPSCYGGDDGSITVTVVSPDPMVDVVEILLDNRDDYTQSGDEYTWTGLRAGNHTLYLRDNRSPENCDNTITLNLTQPDSIEVYATATATACTGDLVNLVVDSVKGGSSTYTSYIWTAVTPGNADPTPTGDPSGITATASPSTSGNVVYRVVVTDDNGCKDSTEVTVSVSAKPEVSIASIDDQCPNAENVEITAALTTGTDPDYTYTWTAESGVTLTSPTSHTREQTKDTIYANMPNTCDGTYTITLYVADDNGCKDTATTTVRVTDNTPPVPNVTEIYADAVACLSAAEVSATDMAGLAAQGFTFSDGCSYVTLKSTNRTFKHGGNSCLDTLVITYTVEDACHREATVTLYQRIYDSLAPVAEHDTIVAASAQCLSDSIKVQTNVANLMSFGYGITDNCTKNAFTIEGVTRTVKHNAMCNDSIIIKYTIADSCGNEKEIWHVQQIKDDTPPTATQTIITADDKQCLGDSITVLDNFAAVNALGYGIEDNCTKNAFTIEGVTRTVKHNDMCNDSIIIKYTVADSCGNTKDVWHVQRIKDDTPPTATQTIITAADKQCLGDSITVLDNFAAVNALGYGIEDNCTKVNFTLEGVTRTVKHNDMCNDSIIIKYTVADSCGNTKDVWHVQKIKDDTPPTATKDTIIADAKQCISDSITVRDNFAAVNALGYGIEDNCTKVNLTIQGVTRTVKHNDICNDSIIIKYTVADSCGNTKDVWHVQKIQDTDDPTAEHDTIIADAKQCISDSITVLGSFATVNALGYGITDNCTKNAFTIEGVTRTVKHNDMCNDSIIIKYTVADSCGNTKDVWHVQKIQDTDAPTAEHDTIIADAKQCISDSITVLGSFATVNALGYGITDNCTKNAFTIEGVTRTVKHNAMCNDSIIIKYTIADSCGNEKEIWHVQQIKDDTPPTATQTIITADDKQCLGDSITVLENFAAVNALGYGIEDNCTKVNFTLEGVTRTVKHNDMCNDSIIIKYTVADSCGNTKNVWHVQRIKDDTPPTATQTIITADDKQCLGDSITVLDNFAAVNALGYGIEDNCTKVNFTLKGVTRTVKHNDMCNDSIIIKYTVADSCGNTKDVWHVQKIKDDTPPTATKDTIIADAKQCISDSITVRDNFAAVNALGYGIEDNCTKVNLTIQGVTRTVKHNDMCNDSIIIKYTVADSCGNTKDVWHVQKIQDTDDPTAEHDTIIADAKQCISDSITVLGSFATVNALGYGITDNCTKNAFTIEGVTRTVKHNDMCNDSIIIKYTIADSCGNTKDVWHVQQIKDDTPPTATQTIITAADKQCLGDSITVLDNFAAVNALGYGIEDNCTKNAFTIEGVTRTVKHNDMCNDSIIIKYTVADSCGNTKDVWHVQKIQDTDAPVAHNAAMSHDTLWVTGTQCLKDSITTESDIADVVTLFDIDDNCTKINFQLKSTSSVLKTGENCADTVVIQYVVADSCNNEATFYHAQPIQDVTAPTADHDTIIADVGQCLKTDSIQVRNDFATVNALGFGIEDNCTKVNFTVQGVERTVRHNDPCIDSVIIKYTIADSCGNTKNVWHIQQIKDEQAPTLKTPNTWPDNVTGQNVCVATSDLSVFLSESDAANLFEDCNTITVTYTQDTVIDKCDWTVRRMYVIADACDNKTYDTITVSGTNKVELTMSPDTTICLGGTANLRSTATVCSGDPIYQWTSESANNGMPGITNTNNLSVMPTNPGVMTYTDTAYDANGCKTVESITVNVIDTASLSATNTIQASICVGGNIAPIAIEYSNATLDYEYNSVSGTLPPGLDITSHGNGKDTITGSITGATIGDIYTFSIIADNADNCGDKVITCTITITNGTKVYDTVTGCDSYTWTSAANPSEDETIDVVGPHDRIFGPYTSVSGCDSSFYLHVVIYDLPTPTMDNDTVCVGSDATLAVNETYAHYDWGNGVDRRDSTVTTTAAGETTYTVTVTDEHNCTADATAKIVVHDTLVPIFVADPNDTICAGSEVTVSETAGNKTDYTYSIAYTAADGTAANSSDSTVTVTYTTAGTYYFDFTITNNTTNCISHKRDTVVVLPKVGLELTGDLSQQVCVGSAIDSVTVTATNAASVEVTADHGITPTYNETTGNIGFTATGNENDVITVTVTAHHDENSCDDSTLTFQVTLSSTKVVNLAREACDSYHWQTANEDRLFTESKDTVIGPYPAANGCDSITNLSVVINSNLTPTINGRTHICQGETDTLTLTATYDEYEWSDGSNGDTLFVTAGGPYSVEVRDVHGCTGTANITVTIDTLPVPVIAGEPTICDGETDTLTVTVDYNSYLWTGGSTYDTLFVTTEGDYTVTVTDGNGCEGTSAVFHVDVLDPITITEHSKDTTYCFGATADSLSFTAHGGNGTYTYQWYVSANGGSYVEITGATDTVYTPATTTAGNYSYKVEVTGECGPMEQVIAVVDVRQPLTVTEAIADDALCLDVTAGEIAVTVTGGTGVYDYVWEVSTDSANYTTASTDSAYTPETTTAGTYYYRLTVTDSLCGDTTLHVQKLVVKPNVGLELVGDLNQTKCIGGSIDSVMVVATNAASVEVTADHGITPTYNTTTGNIGFATAGNENDVITVTVVAHHDENSCDDSTLTFQVTLSALTTKNLTVTGCGSYHWATANEDTLFTATTDTIIGPYPSTNGCDSMTYLHVDVNGGEMPVFSLPEDVCVTASETNDSIEISVQALTGYTYVWDIDGGVRAASSPLASDGVSDTNIVVVRWANDGDKTVSVTLTSLETSCTGTNSKTIHVHVVPAISIAAVTGDICPHSGSVDLVANLNPTTTADYTYDWGGEVTVATTTPVTSETSNTATATIPTTSCDTTYNVGVSVVDGNGCKAVADSVTLVVRDVEAPTFTRPADDTIYKNDICEYDAAVAETGDVSNLDDNCTAVADLTVTHTDDTIAGSCYGATIIRRAWRVTDLCGNISDAADSVQTITILDTVAPVIAGPMNEVTVEGCDESAVPAVAASDTTIAYMLSQGVTSVTDYCSDEAHLTVSISDGAMTGDCDHEVIRTYTVTDDCGNSSSTTQTITITRPTFVVPAMDTTTVVCENDATAPTPATVTLCGTEYTAQPVNTGDTNRVTETVGGYLYITYNYEYTDCKGSYAWHKTYKLTPGEFTPVDSVYDVVACPSDIDSIPVPTVIVCGETVPFTFTGMNTTDTARCGDSIYNYAYTVNGTTYNWAYIVRFEPGDFSMPADDSVVVHCPSAIVLPNTVAGRMPEVHNACGEDISDQYALASQPDEIPTCEGRAVYTYSYTDCAGHSHEWHFIYILEREDFTIAAEPGSATVVCAAEALGAGEAGSVVTLPTVTAMCDGEPPLMPIDTIEGQMPSCDGAMTYTYRYNDCTGNHQHDWVFTYTVRDSIAPTIAPIADRMANAGGGCEYVIPDLSNEVNATDNCGETHFMGQTPTAGTRYQQTEVQQQVEVIVQVDDDCENHGYDTVIVTIPARNPHVTVNPTNPAVCAGGSVDLTAEGHSNATGTDEYNWNPTNGLSDATGAVVTASPAATTQYTVTYKDGNDCIATASAIVTINPLPTLNASNRDQEVCAGGAITTIEVSATYANVTVTGLPTGVSYNSNTSTISGRPTASGTYTITATSIYGCEPIELNGTITVRDTIRDTTNAEACDTYLWTVNNTSYSQSGTYSAQSLSPNGCISLELLNLTVNHRSYGIDEVDSCDHYTWMNGQTYDISTNTPIYTIQGGNAEGCDSVVTLHLSLHNSSVSEVNESSCDQYTWFGTTYTESIVATLPLQSRWGCDSTITLHLTIYPSYHFDADVDSICDGDYYTYHGNNYNETGVYHVELHTRAGCDSVYSLNLTVLQPKTVSISDSYDCKEGVYILEANTLSENLLWSEYRDHGQLSAQDTAFTIRVAPPETTTYTVTVGYGPELMCPSSESITLDELVVPIAAIQTRPNYLSIDHNQWYADDASVGETDGREWYVDGEFYSQQSQHIDGEIAVNPFGEPDSVTLMLIVHSDRCDDTADAVIPLVWSEIWVPNVFTPGLDINNLFSASGIGIIEIETWVFTREGLLVWHGTSLEEKWDGKHQSTGTECKQDAYTYRINYRFITKPEELQTKVGLVMLLR